LRHPRLALSTAVAAALVGLLLITVSLPQGQTQRSWKPPHTSWGDPDLQGIWNNSGDAQTPFERPDELAGRDTISESEARELLSKSLAEEFVAGGTGADPQHWYERPPSRRTSLIQDPPDGRLPAMTSEGERRASAKAAVRRSRGPADSWEDLEPFTRCITRGVPGAMVPDYYNANYHIMQAPGYLAILYEMIHDVRIIPLDGRRALDKGIRLWMGDSRGHWEGNTLVVEVTNFNDLANGSASDRYRLIERFTRLSPDTIRYEYTVDDPGTWARPWTVRSTLTTTHNPGVIYEYACHEGNYAVTNVLRGARSQEQREREGSEAKAALDAR